MNNPETIAGSGGDAFATQARVAPPPLRQDLLETKQTYLGRQYSVLKNPLGLTYYRLPKAHVVAARMFDGKRSIADIAGQLRGESNYWRAMPPRDAVAELASLAVQLAHGGLLQVKGVGATERSKKMRELKKSRVFEMSVAKMLFFRKSLVDPDYVLERLLPFFRWMFAPAVLVLASLLVFSALAMAVFQWEKVTVQGANFFTFDNLALTWLLFIVVKVFHEFGHAITCKHFGGEIHEMGFLFILFTPYLFCNVTDSWRAPKMQRIGVTAAGIGVELVIASIAAWVWFFTQPGLLHQMSFNTMVLCSISTILFNGNPLMKFDGYYILTDALEIPNLRAKSNAWVTAWAQYRLLGISSAKAKLQSPETGPVFGVYAVAAYIYQWFIMFSISIMIFNILEPFGLQFVSRTYVALFLFVSLALPLYRLGKSLQKTPEFRQQGLRRGLVVVGILAAAMGFLLFLPWKETIRRTVALEHSAVEVVSSGAGGILQEVNIRSAEKVAKGQVLGTLRNVELEGRLDDLTLQQEVMQVRLRELTSQDTEQARLQVPLLQNQAQELATEIQGLVRKVSTLQLRAPLDGVVRTNQPGKLKGLHFTPNQTVFEIGDATRLRVLIPLDEKQTRRVRPGQEVAVRFAAWNDEVFYGVVTAVPQTPETTLSTPGLSNLLGGDVPSQMREAGVFEPTSAYYEAEAVIELPPENASLLRPGATGRAAITIQKTTFGNWLREKFLDAIDPSIRL